MYKIAFIILTWNSDRHISNCIESIINMNDNVFERRIIVIDNGSSDNTIESIEQVIRGNDSSSVSIETIELEHNSGTTVSRNIGIREVLNENGSEYVCILDSDTIVNTMAFTTMIEVLQKDPSCGIIGPRMCDDMKVYQRSGRHIPTVTEKILKILPFETLKKKGIVMESSIKEEGNGSERVGYLMSACWLMKTEVIRKVGLLDEKIFYAPEDVEYCIRCWKNGYNIQYCYDAEIVHLWQRLSRKKLFSKHNFEHVKGLIYMFWKHKFLFSTKKITSEK